jgi:hypothetical protein
MTKIRVDSRQNFSPITLDNGIVRATVLPELGGKIISLVRLASGREYLISHPSGVTFRKPQYGSTFVDNNNVGFDECIPSIAACTYPEGAFVGASLPDHGDVWSLRWEYKIEGGQLSLSVEGRSLPYIFRKRLTLQGNELVLEYELENKSGDSFQYLWSSHPLLATEPGAKILLQLESATLLIDSSKGGRLGAPGESCSWPITRLKNGKRDDLSVMKTRGSASDKIFTPRLSKGYCGLHYPSTDESIVFKFDVATIPYVGLWICHGGTGPHNPLEPYTIAMEPCNGRPDSLVQAMARGECAKLLPQAINHWSLRLGLHEGVSRIEQLIAHTGEFE